LFLLSFAFGRVIIFLEASRSNFLVSILKYGLKIMYALLLVLIVLLFLLLQTREHFGAYVGLNGVSSSDNGGAEIFTLWPNTCRPTEDYDAGLCYTKCKPGFHGIGPVCWADSVNIGVGTPVGLEKCPDGWSNDGLICREPIRNDCSWKGLFGECWGRLVGGALRGRLDNGGTCPGPGGGDDHVDKIDGLCYKKCPKDLPQHIPGMPYLCYKGEGLSYGRGVGTIPATARFFRSLYFTLPFFFNG
jgi:hypothetical protein